MPFMFITLTATVIVTVVVFFRTSPHVANRRALLAFNAITLAISLPAAIVAGYWLYGDAIVVKPGERGMAAFLAIIGGSAVALFIVAVGGLLRNFVVFPRSKRLDEPGGPEPS